MTETGFDDDGAQVPVEQFNYAAVDGGDPSDPPDSSEQLTPEQLEIVMRVVRQLIEWIWQDGMRDPRGIMLRAIIICWIFLKRLHPLGLTDLAGAFGLHKQSLGRWVDEFKRAFPHIKTPHMRSP